MPLLQSEARFRRSASGRHARNYGDLPLFDMLFGSFHNPPGFARECGFYEGGSERVGAMLIGRKLA